MQQEEDSSYYQQQLVMQENQLQQQRELQGEADAGYRDEEDRRGDFGELEVEEDDEDLGLDIDNMGYEALQALGDAIGNVSKGLGSSKIAALPAMSYASHKAACQQGAVAMDRFKAPEASPNRQEAHTGQSVPGLQQGAGRKNTTAQYEALMLPALGWLQTVTLQHRPGDERGPIESPPP
ncbi:MAG: hypothetical protein WDW38_003423 [Sanguina aurantia]